jgi:hypothetical protein
MASLPCLGLKRNCCLCKRSSRQTTLVCVNAPRRNQRLTLPLHLAAEITDTCSPSLYISLLLAQIDNIIHSFSYAHFGYVHHMNNRNPTLYSYLVWLYASRPVYCKNRIVYLAISKSGFHLSFGLSSDSTVSQCFFIPHPPRR